LDRLASCGVLSVLSLRRIFPEFAQRLLNDVVEAVLAKAPPLEVAKYTSAGLFDFAAEASGSKQRDNVFAALSVANDIIAIAVSERAKRKDLSKLGSDGRRYICSFTNVVARSELHGSVRVVNTRWKDAGAIKHFKLAGPSAFRPAELLGDTGFRRAVVGTAAKKTVHQGAFTGIGEANDSGAGGAWSEAFALTPCVGGGSGGVLEEGVSEGIDAMARLAVDKEARISLGVLDVGLPAKCITPTDEIDH
jgi:hypothetical protein